VCTTVGGFGLLGLILFILGQLSFRRFGIGIVLLIGVAAALAKGSRSCNLRLSVEKVPATIVTCVLLITALGGLAEPVGDWGIDGVAYHYVGPKVWLREGIIRPIPDNAPTSYPSLAETVFAAMRAFGGEQAPAFSAFWTLALLLAVSAEVGRRCGLGVRGAWWVAALLATMGALYEGSHSGFIDAIYAGFVLAAIRVGLDSTEKKHFIAVGLFCGLAIASKYPGLLATPVIIFILAWQGKSWERLRKAIPNAITGLVVASVLAAPFYFRNWILLGSPIYPPPPGATEFLQVKYYSEAGLRAFYQFSVSRGNGMGRGPLSLVLLPYNLTYHTSQFNGAGGIGLAPLAFAWFGVFASWRKTSARRLTLVGFFLLVLWFITYQESRYLIHFYAISAIFAVLGWEWIVIQVGRRGKVLCACVVAISVLYGLILEVKSRISDLHSVFSPVYADERRQKAIPYLKSFEYINRDPLVTRILILDRSVPAYYSNKDYVKPFGQWGEQMYVDSETAADILPRLNELHPSHILDVQSQVSGFSVPPNYPGLTLVFDQPGQKIYRFAPPRLSDTLP
jgi:hypothetical protein